MVSKAETEEIRDILDTPQDADVEENNEETEAELESPPGDADDTPDSDDELGAVGAEQADDEAGESDDVSYTPETLAEAIGWETDDIYNSVNIPMKDGETVTLGEFKNKYQDLSHENAQLQTQLTEAKTGLEQAQTGVTQNHQMSAELIEQLGYLDQIKRTEESTDWKELEDLDPTEAVLKRDKIRRAKDEVGAKINEIQAGQQQAQAQFLQQQAGKMIELIPQWKDDAVREKDQTSMRTLMKGYGVSDDEINTISDPRLMAAFRDFMLLKDKSASASEAVKRVRSAPKVLKGKGFAKARPDEKVDALVNKARETGNKKDELNAVKALMQQANN